MASPNRINPKIFDPNIQDMTPFSFGFQENPLQNRSQQESKKKSGSFYEDDFFDSQPQIVVKDPPSSTNVSKQMSKMFKEPKVPKIVSGPDHHDKERRASGESHSPRIKNRVSPRTLSPSPRHSPSHVVSNEDTSHEHVKHHSNMIFSGFGANPVVDDKQKTKSDFQAQSRSSHDSLTYKPSEQKSLSPHRSEDKRKQFTQSTGNMTTSKCIPQECSGSDESMFNNKLTPSYDSHRYGRKLSVDNKKEKESSSKWYRKSSGSTESKEARLVSAKNTRNESPEERTNRPSSSFTSSDEIYGEKRLVRNYGPQTKCGVYSTDSGYQLDPMKDATLIFGQEAEEFNEKFLNEWGNYSFPDSMYCNVEQVRTCVSNLIRKKFGSNVSKNSTELDKLGMEFTPRSEDSQRDDILKLLQKELIRSCSIGKRLRDGMDFISRHSKTNYNKATFFTVSLYEVYKELILNSSACQDLSPFLSYQDKVDSKLCVKMGEINLSYFPEKRRLEEHKAELIIKKTSLHQMKKGLRKINMNIN